MVTKGLAAALNAKPRAGTPWLQALGSHRRRLGQGEVPRITPLEQSCPVRIRPIQMTNNYRAPEGHRADWTGSIPLPVRAGAGWAGRITPSRGCVTL